MRRRQALRRRKCGRRLRWKRRLKRDRIEQKQGIAIAGAFSRSCFRRCGPLLGGDTDEQEDKRGVDKNAGRQADDESANVVDGAQQRHDRAAVHDVILDAELSRDGARDGTTDDVSWNDLQRTSGSERNRAFGDTEHAHEEGGDTGIALCLVEPAAANQGGDANG